MMRLALRAFVPALLAGALLAGCSGPSSEAQPSSEPASSSGAASAKTAVLANKPAAAVDVAALEAAGGVAYFAGGCFWGVEHFLEQIDGVVRVESGYMGGHVEDPSYEDVSSQESGHLETVRVYFDPAAVSYEAIAKRFFEIHDPTQADGQGPDIGPEYRSAVFVTGEEQREIVEGLIERLRERGYEVVTQIHAADEFWLAEDDHQDYYAKHGKTPYCHAPVDRFGDT
jgi:methionine-S-sulfoxide reductase